MGLLFVLVEFNPTETESLLAVVVVLLLRCGLGAAMEASAQSGSEPEAAPPDGEKKCYRPEKPKSCGKVALP